MISKAIILIILVSLLLSPMQGVCQDEPDVVKYSILEYLSDNLPTNPGRKIVLDETRALLTDTDTSSNQKLIERLIKAWDTRPPQIAIEARIIEVTITDIYELGIEWEFGRPGQSLYMGSGTAASPGSGSSPSGSGTSMIGTTTPDRDAGVSGLGFRIGKNTFMGNQLFAYLRALEATDNARLLSSPKITTLSGQPAVFKVVKTLPYATSVERVNIGTTASASWVETYSIEEQEVGITLEVTPRVTEEGDVVMLELHPLITVLVEQNPISTAASFPSTLGWPTIDTRSANATVIVRSGETVVMGGLIEDSDTVYDRKVPFLGDIPVLGKLFKYKSVNREKKNLLIFITATLVPPSEEAI